MDKKLKDSVLSFAYWINKAYDIMDDLKVGVIPDETELEDVLFNLEKANLKRISLLKERGETNLSSSFVDAIIFKDCGEIVDGKLVGPADGAIDFIVTNENSSNLFIAQMATYVAVCL